MWGELPSDWEVTTLGELGRIYSGSTPSRAVPSYWGGTIPWVTPGELTSHRPKSLDVTRETITKAGLASSGAHLLPIGSLLVTTRATLGSAALAAVPMATNQGFRSIAFGNEAVPDFLYHLTPLLVRELTRRASGTTFLEISAQEFAAVEVPVPPVAEQRRIAEILDTLDAAIEQTERLIAKLRQMKQGLLHDLLTRGIDDNGELRDPERHPEQFRDSPLGQVPRAWSVRSIASVCPTVVDYRGMTPPYTRGGVPVISQEDVQLDGLRPTTKWVSERTADRWTYRGRLESGDVVFRMERFIGEVVQVPAGRRHVITRGVLALRPDPTLSSKSFLFWSLFKRKRDDGWGIHGHATTVPRMYKPDLLEAELAFPGLAEQARITAVLDAHECRLQDEIAAAAKLRTLKHGLMHDLLTGRVRTTPDASP